MGYEIVVQDFVVPFETGAGYLGDINLYSGVAGEDYSEIEENPHELFEGMGMGKVTTNKCEYEAEPEEFYQDTISETEDYVFREMEEEEIRIVSWENQETEEIVRDLEENHGFEREGASIKEPGNEDVF